MKKILAALFLLLGLSLSAHAQTAQVVTTCGTLGQAYTAGAVRSTTQDVNGLGCMGGSLTQSGTWTVQPGNTANTTPWLVTLNPSAAAGAATTSASSPSVESNRVLKASAGNLYNITVTIGATSGYAMLFDATVLPSNGAVTPVWCVPVNSNATNGFIAAEWATPKAFAVGITAGFSTTGCFTLTASATANFFGGYK